MKQLRELQEKRALAVEANEALVRTAMEAENGEGRNLTDEEAAQFDQREADIKELDVQIERAKVVAERAKEVAAKEARAVGDHTAKSISEEKEVKRFSYGKFLTEITGHAGAPGFEKYRSGLTGFEKEMNQEAQNEARNIGTEVRGYGVPGIILEKRDLTAGTTTTGGHTVETTVNGSIIEFLRANMVLTQAGATYLPGLQGDVLMPRNDAAGSYIFATENATATETTPTFDSFTLSPKRLTGFIDLSRQLVLQSKAVPSIEAFVMNDIMMGIALAIENAALNGSGAGANPTGVRNISGVGTVSMGASAGGNLTWAKIVEFETTLSDANANKGNVSWITNPSVVGHAKTVEKATNTGMFLYEDGAMNNFNVYSTTQIPKNLVEGASSDLSSLILGNWSELLIGQWGGLDIIVNPFTKAKEALIEYVPNVYVDINARHAASFVVSDDVDATTPA